MRRDRCGLAGAAGAGVAGKGGPAIAGIALALAPGLAAYVPLGHRTPAVGSSTPRHPVRRRIEKLRPLFEDPGVLKIGHDVKTTAHLLSRSGIALAPL